MRFRLQALTLAHNNFEPVAKKKQLLPTYKNEGGQASDYNQEWDAAAGNFVTAAIDNSGQNNWVGVNEKCTAKKNPTAMDLSFELLMFHPIPRLFSALYARRFTPVCSDEMRFKTLL